MSDLRLTRGDSYSLPFAVTDSSGNAVNLTGYSGWFTVKHSTSDTDGSAIMQLTVGNGVTVPSPTDGTGTIDIASSNWSGYTAPKNPVYWDLQFKASTGEVYTVDSGRIWVKQDVTLSTS